MLQYITTFIYLCAMIRKSFLYKDYFKVFFNNQSDKVKCKIIWVLRLIETIERIPEDYIKHIKDTDGLYEIRVQSGNNIFRIFCFFDEDKIVVLMNGFQKKTQKTPVNEINIALKIKKEYENEKLDIIR